MAMNPLPPQAYTKETLQKAYQWLLTQNASIKEMASNQEILVSLYLKAQRNGDASLEAPSIQNFKQELKSLANMMGDFQGPQTPPAGASATPMNTASQTTQATHTAAPVIKNNFLAAVTNGATNPSVLNELDQHSLLLIQEAKMFLNLSSDTEALRALISLGHRQFKKMNS